MMDECLLLKGVVSTSRSLEGRLIVTPGDDSQQVVTGLGIASNLMILRFACV